MARSRRTPAMHVGRCSSQLSGHRLQGNLKSHSLRPERSEVESLPRAESNGEGRFSPTANGYTWKQRPLPLSSRLPRPWERSREPALSEVEGDPEFNGFVLEMFLGRAKQRFSGQ